MYICYEAIVGKHWKVINGKPGKREPRPHQELFSAQTNFDLSHGEHRHDVKCPDLQSVQAEGIRWVV